MKNYLSTLNENIEEMLTSPLDPAHPLASFAALREVYFSDKPFGECAIQKGFHTNGVSLAQASYHLRQTRCLW